MTKQRKPVQNPMTAVLTAKSPEDYLALRQIIERLQSLPAYENPVAVALTKISTVHFARFSFISSNQLAVITTYDGDFEAYINEFINEIGDIFNALLKHVENAPPLPVQTYRQQFLDYIFAIDHRCVGSMYTAYPDCTVLDILDLTNTSA